VGREDVERIGQLPLARDEFVLTAAHVDVAVADEVHVGEVELAQLLAGVN
jgi:hypothetical protein